MSCNVHECALRCCQWTARHHHNITHGHVASPHSHPGTPNRMGAPRQSHFNDVFTCFDTLPEPEGSFTGKRVALRQSEVKRIAPGAVIAPVVGESDPARRGPKSSVVAVAGDVIYNDRQLHLGRVTDRADGGTAAKPPRGQHPRGCPVDQHAPVTNTAPEEVASVRLRTGNRPTTDPQVHTGQGARRPGRTQAS